MTVISGTVYWNKTVVPHRFNESEPLKWTIDIGNLGKKDIKLLETVGLGHRVKNKAEGIGTKGADSDDSRGHFITFSTRVERPNGRGTNKPPRFIDAEKNELHPATNEWLGNGSKVNVSFEGWDSQYGKTATIQTIQIVDRKEYVVETSDDELDVVPGGFVNEDDEIPFPSN